MTGGFAKFSSCFILPKEMETFEGRRVINTLAELEEVFDDVRRYYQSIGMTRMERRIVDSEFRNSTTIVSTHNSRLYAEDQLIQQPFDVLSVIELVEGAWRIRHSEYAITDSNAHNHALVGQDAKLVDRAET